MGGDGGVDVTVTAALAAARAADITLVGDRRAIEPVLLAGDSPGRPEIIHTEERIEQGDSLATILRHRARASLRLALECVREGRADAVVSGGDTAALMALARHVIGQMPGIRRPAICKALQGSAGPFWMLDLGANLACDAAQLVQFAHMGSAVAQASGCTHPPRVALLNIGTETGKGPPVLHAAAALLAAESRLAFVGYIEGNRLFRDEADVVVTDGFAGNIALKSIEGAAWMAGQLLRRWFESLGLIEQAGMALARGRLEALRHEMNPQRYNGASLVGLRGIVVKSHGSADAEGFESAIGQAIREVQGDLLGQLALRFAV